MKPYFGCVLIAGRWSKIGPFENEALAARVAASVAVVAINEGMGVDIALIQGEDSDPNDIAVQRQSFDSSPVQVVGMEITDGEKIPDGYQA